MKITSLSGVTSVKVLEMSTTGPTVTNVSKSGCMLHSERIPFSDHRGRNIEETDFFHPTSVWE